MARLNWKSTASYVALLAAAYLVGVAGSWIFGAQLDNYAYDYWFRLYQPKLWQPQSVLLAIDEPTLSTIRGGMHGIRKPLADALRLVAAASPKAVAVDVILAERSENPAVDAALAEAFRSTPNLVLSCELIDEGRRWEDPLEEFRRGAALGHVYADPDKNDSVTRAIPLEKRSGHVRRWALSLEAFRLSRGAPIIESPAHLQVGGAVIPVRASGDGRLMRVRFVPYNMAPVPRVSMAGLLANPALAGEFTGKVVFVGVTALTEVRDRLLTPYALSRQTTGIEINADAFETMAQGLFITDVSDFWVLLFSLGLAIAAGLAFRYLPGWQAYAAGVLILLAAGVTPYVFFTHRRVLSLATPASAALLGTMTAAAYYHLVVRRNLRIEQAARARYQQAMHFVTHEMRTPLSAIQGSSELISRYALTEEKRKQIALLINSESKRLARMVEIFLNVERLSAGQMELKHESIPVKQMVDVCVERVKPLGERKHIAITLDPIPEELQLTGDRELMEYACYNLLTNAVKYSPQRTEVRVSGWRDDGHVRIAVKDQGIGMDQKEVKQVFQKFYRTKKAEESGEAGSGIGLSIVQQIVEQHGGKIEVTSEPGEGSCFTVVIPTVVE
ncbi:MAG: CHASE2 domain-containing protein [Bryobacteraceae bacterium]